MSNGVIRVGMVGMGGISFAHEAGYTDSADVATIAAMCDVNAAAARDRASPYGAKVYTDYHDLIADPDIDLVDITSPHRTHYPVALAALRAGKHVLVEKPMAMNYAEARELIQVAEANVVRITVAENTRFVPGYRVAERMLLAGELGEVRLVRTFIAGTEAARIRSNSSWVGDPNERGVIQDSGVHTFYLLKWLFGGIRDIQAFASRILPESRVEDDATMVGHLTNGAAFVAGITCIVEAPWTERLEIHGSGGSLIIDHLVNPTAVFFHGADDVDGAPLPEVEFEPLGWKLLSIMEEVKDFAHAVAEQRAPLVAAADGAYAVQVAEAAYASLLQGHAVTLETL